MNTEVLDGVMGRACLDGSWPAWALLLNMWAISDVYLLLGYESRALTGITPDLLILEDRLWGYRLCAHHSSLCLCFPPPDHNPSTDPPDPFSLLLPSLTPFSILFRAPGPHHIPGRCQMCVCEYTCVHERRFVLFIRCKGRTHTWMLRLIFFLISPEAI